MLAELRIENFAIIDKIDLEFGPGLVILTGETGAGKSIIIDAVETLLGVRADMTMVRTGVANSSVEGTFKIMPKVREAVHAILEEAHEQHRKSAGDQAESVRRALDMLSDLRELMLFSGNLCCY